MPSAPYFAQATDLKFSLMLLGWSSGTGEASSPLKALLATYNKDKGFGTANRGRYSNTKVDALLEEALATVDDPKREAILQRATEIAINDTGDRSLAFPGEPVGDPQRHHVSSAHRREHAGTQIPAGEVMARCALATSSTQAPQRADALIEQSEKRDNDQLAAISALGVHVERCGHDCVGMPGCKRRWCGQVTGALDRAFRIRRNHDREVAGGNEGGPVFRACARPQVPRAHRGNRRSDRQPLFLRWHRRYQAALVAPTDGPAWLTDLVLGDHPLGSSSSATAVAGYPEHHGSRRVRLRAPDRDFILRPGLERADAHRFRPRLRAGAKHTQAASVCDDGNIK